MQILPQFAKTKLRQRFKGIFFHSGKKEIFQYSHALQNILTCVKLFRQSDFSSQRKLLDKRMKDSSQIVFFFSPKRIKLTQVQTWLYKNTPLADRFKKQQFVSQTHQTGRKQPGIYKVCIMPKAKAVNIDISFDSGCSKKEKQVQVLQHALS